MRIQVHLELHRAEHNEDDDILKKASILDVCKSFQAALANMSGKSRYINVHSLNPVGFYLIEVSTILAW